MDKCDESKESPKDEVVHSKAFLTKAMKMKTMSSADKRKAKAVGGKKRGMKR